MVNVGKLDRYVTVQQATWTHSDNTNDRYPSTWSTYKNVWASRVQKQSQELSEGNQFVLLDTYEYKIRYYDAPGITGLIHYGMSNSVTRLFGINSCGSVTVGVVLKSRFAGSIHYVMNRNSPVWNL